MKEEPIDILTNAVHRLNLTSGGMLEIEMLKAVIISPYLLAFLMSSETDNAAVDEAINTNHRESLPREVIADPSLMMSSIARY